MKKWWLVFAGVLVFWILVRGVLPSELDDVAPGISCEDWLMDEADVYWVIPRFENVSIDSAWCSEILDRGKEIGMHGVYHTYEEFGEFRDEGYFNEGADVFAECFGFEPTMFKPGQLAWTKENEWMEYRVDVKLGWNQFFHKVYHCGDTGVLPNWVVRLV